MRLLPQKHLRPPRWDWALIALFVLAIWAPSADLLFHLDHAPPPRENRFLALPPRMAKFQAGRIQNYLAQCQAWFADHFGFRNRLVGWSQAWRLAWYHEGDRFGMVTGPHEWQFYGELQMVEHHLGWMQFTPKDLEAWRSLLEKRRDWLAQRHIQYLFVVAPDKQTIYPDELPGWFADAPHGQTKLDQFISYMRGHSTVPVLDLREPLTAARKTAPTYLEHDTHWNLFGGFVACQQMVQMLPLVPPLPPLRLDDFVWSNAPLMGGDLVSGLKEHNYYVFQPKPSLPALGVFLSTNVVPGWDAHGTYTVIENPAPLPHSAVIFHDSFGLAWRKFLGYEFKQVVFMPDRRKFDAELIDRVKPDVVVNEIVERYFNVLDPEEMKAMDALPLPVGKPGD
jgi:alginate O-acetyltransferase complex protein AlgJ